MKSGKLDPRPVITGELPLAQFDSGFKQLTTGAREGLKIILRP
jgi:threonine dehydrogenase-like Zn-dependent dehydrogenase